MKLLSYKIDHRTTYGIVAWDGVIDLGRRLEAEFPTLRSVIEANAFDRLEAFLGSTSTDTDFDSITFLPPLPNPGTIYCVGVNYPDRNAEYRDKSDAPANPSLFIRTAESFTGNNQPILRPPESKQLDYEGEIALVIGKAGRRIPEDKALDHVAGLTCANDGTIRDWVRHGKFNVTQGKNFAESGAIGPWIVTPDEIGDLENLELITRVNGEVRQHDTTANLMFPFARLISYISTFATLKPGDIILTGTPTGAGARFEPPLYLKPGDVVEVQVSGIGVLVNRVEDENHPRMKP